MTDDERSEGSGTRQNPVLTDAGAEQALTDPQEEPKSLRRLKAENKWLRAERDKFRDLTEVEIEWWAAS